MQFINPETAFGYGLLTQSVVSPMAGGLGTLWGPVVGTGVLYPLQQEMSNLFPSLPVGSGLLLYGVIVILIMRVEPHGIVALLSRLGRYCYGLISHKDTSRANYPESEDEWKVASASKSSQSGSVGSSL